MRIARIASCICALAFVLMNSAGIVAHADAPPSASAAELKDAASEGAYHSYSRQWRSRRLAHRHHQ